jgi:hypothetical protein
MTLDTLLKQKFGLNETRTTCARENVSADDVTCVDPAVQRWVEIRKVELKNSLY